MTRITIGRAAPTRANDESVVIHLKGERARLSPKQARWLCERIDEELALLDGSDIDAVDAVDAPEASSDLEDRLQALYERVDADTSTVERVAREWSAESVDEQPDADDVLDGVDERTSAGEYPPDEQADAEYQVGDEVPGEASESAEDVRGLDELTAMQGVGERRVEKLIDAGFRDLGDVDDASVGAIAVDGISEEYATKISRFAAEALAEQDGTDDEDESDDDQEGSERDDPEPAADGSEEPADPDLPFGCPVLDCRKRFDDRDDRRTHRDNDHDEAAVMVGYRERARDDLSDGVSVLDVEQAAVRHTLVSGVAEQLDVANSDARKWLNMLQLNDVLKTGGEGQAVQVVEDLHEKLGIDEPLPNRPDQGGSA